VKVTHAGGCEERRGSVNERGGCQKVTEIERGEECWIGDEFTHAAETD